MASLIEGLPDAVAMRCLARVPLSMHGIMRTVSKAWKSAFTSQEIYRIRKECGLMQEWLYVSCYDPDRAWEAYDSALDHWHVLPSMPTTIRHLSNYGSVGLGSKLFVVGGGSDDVDPVDGERHGVLATNEVWCFDPILGKWEKRAPMKTARSQFACCAVSGRIIAAGGFACTRKSLASAEIYDPELDIWEPIAELGLVHDAACSGVVLDGKVHVIHKGDDKMQVYEPSLKKWMVQDCPWPKGPMAVVNGELYVVSNGTISCEDYQLRSQKFCWTWPDYLYRIGFTLAGLGTSLCVVAGVLPTRLHIELLKIVDIWDVAEGVHQRRETTMRLCSGTVVGCAVVPL